MSSKQLNAEFATDAHSPRGTKEISSLALVCCSSAASHPRTGFIFLEVAAVLPVFADCLINPVRAAIAVSPS